MKKHTHILVSGKWMRLRRFRVVYKLNKLSIPCFMLIEAISEEQAIEKCKDELHKVYGKELSKQFEVTASFDGILMKRKNNT